MMTPRSLADKIDALHELSERIKDKEREVKELEEQYDALSEKAMAQMDQQKASGFKATKAQASITMSVVPIWDAEDPAAFQKFQKYVLKNGALHLLEKRVAVKAWRELKDAGKDVPGLVPFVKRRLNVTKL